LDERKTKSPPGCGGLIFRETDLVEEGRHHRCRRAAAEIVSLRQSQACACDSAAAGAAPFEAARIAWIVIAAQLTDFARLRQPTIALAR
jgi:hypothetical protein